MGTIAKYGDPTTTGGKIFAFDGNQMNNGMPIALDGDKASCGSCGDIWPISGTCTHMSFDGRNAVQHGDLVCCPCGRNRVIAISTDMYYEQPARGDQAANVCPRALAANRRESAAAYTGAFVIRNKHTGWPIPHITYRLKLPDGTLVDGVTDDSGLTNRITAETRQVAQVEVYL